MTVGMSLIVILVGLAIAAWVNGLIGLIVAAVGLVGLIVSAFASMRARA